MILDVAALVILGLFILMGALRGGVASLASLVTLVIAYGAGVFAAQELGAAVSEKFGLPAVVGPAVAGTAAFLGAGLFGGVVGALVKRWARSLRGDSSMSLVNRWLGGLFGAARGALIVLLLSWLAIWLDAARATGSFAGLEAVPEVEQSLAAKVTEKVVQVAVSAAMNESGAAGDVVAKLASRPADAVRSLQSLLADPRIEALQRDRFFWTLVENGASNRAMNRGSFQLIAKNDALRAKFADIGVIDEKAAKDPAQFRESFGKVLDEVGPRLKGLVEDPDLQRLAGDPEITSLLESGDTLGLIRHEGVQRLVAKVSNRP